MIKWNTVLCILAISFGQVFPDEKTNSTFWVGISNPGITTAQLSLSIFKNRLWALAGLSLSGGVSFSPDPSPFATSGNVHLGASIELGVSFLKTADFLGPTVSTAYFLDASGPNNSGLTRDGFTMAEDYFNLRMGMRFLKQIHSFKIGIGVDFLSYKHFLSSTSLYTDVTGAALLFSLSPGIYFLLGF